MEKIAVLMATYNGEAYLRQQLDSILNQTWTNVVLYIRDDHSSDRTPEILREYEQKDPQRVRVVLGQDNLGYPGCFYALTDDPSIQADYYAFADQDDEWYPDKLERAMKVLAGIPVKKPVAYYAGYDICDEQLQVIRQSAPVCKKYRLKDTLFEVCGLEFTMVITRGALELLNDNKPVKANARGMWMSMLYAGLGQVIYDNHSVARYRRHGGAVTNSQTGIFGIWLWRIKTFFFGGFEEYRVMLTDFYEVCGSKLSERDRKLLELFVPGNYFKKVFKKVFYPRRLRNRLTDELAVRLMFLLGQL
jgi:rhamnosyltransferase